MKTSGGGVCLPDTRRVGEEKAPMEGLKDALFFMSGPRHMCARKPHDIGVIREIDVQKLKDTLKE